MEVLSTPETTEQLFFGKKILHLREKPVIMGILNLTPDSFSDGGRYQTVDAALQQAAQMICDGAKIIDIGGESSRPGARRISAREEMDRVLPVISELSSRFPEVFISIDTYKSEVAGAALAAGAGMVNDISAGILDPAMLDVVAKAGCPYIAMHMSGTPDTMQANPVYENVLAEIMDFFSQRLQLFARKGINQVVLDPGIGFGKQLNHNMEILQKARRLKIFNRPILLGTSRKSLFGQLLGRDISGRLAGTLATTSLAFRNGIDIVRVHDIKENADLLKTLRNLGGTKTGD